MHAYACMYIYICVCMYTCVYAWYTYMKENTDSVYKEPVNIQLKDMEGNIA
jgi:hypothetical protein